MPADWPKRDRALPDYQPDDAGYQPHKSADRRRDEKTLDGSHDAASQAKRAGAALVPPLGSGTKACRPHSLFSADR